MAKRTAALPPLPAGRHTLAFDGDPTCRCQLIVAPTRCYTPHALRAGGRCFGLAAHLYALRRRGDQGIGDFTTLAAAGATTGRAGGAVLGINPLHALFAGDRDRASPYHPSDRRFLDPIYIDVERVPDLADAAEARALLGRDAARIAALASRAHIDPAAVWDVKRAILQACFARFERRAAADPLVAEFDRFVAAGGEALGRYAVFEAIAAAHPRVPWPAWPLELRRPDGPAVAAFAAAHGGRVRFALYLQWLADRQFAAAARDAHAGGLAIGLFRDLAVGAAPDGAEPWANPDAFAQRASIGAPPDSFSPAGQVWSLPPPIPAALSASGCAGFGELVAANMRHAGALRIDHVMGLARLFWIPEGAAPADGAYVRYPEDALVATVALESARARCLVVGEDLGTVPEGFRERLARADILSSRVLWFERDGAAFAPPHRWPAGAAAFVSTHDLPTIAGWWTGADIDERQALGRLASGAADDARSERRTAKHALAEALDHAGATAGAAIDVAAPYDAAVAHAIHRFVGATPAALVMLQADDLAGETAALNLPGTDRERPNWRRKVKVDVGELWRTPIGAQAAIDLASRRTRG